jgi:two-component system LytT family response regulator
MPATIFVTAYDEHALRAFDLAAVDYLVKPYDDERFEQAFRRARRMVEMEGRNRVLDHLVAVLQGSAPLTTPAKAPAKYLERIAVQMKGKISVVPVGDIEYITASGVYAELHVGSQRHLVREAIQALEEQLDPDRFLRIHRGAIVRADLVEALFRTPSGDYEVQLRGGVRLRVGRSRREIVQRRLGRS